MYELAFPNQPLGDGDTATVEYSRGAHGRGTGSLTPGHKVEVKDGMVFDVTAPLVRDPSTSRLLDDGYDLVVQGGHLIIRQIPYVTTNGVVAHGSLTYPVTVSGDQITDDSGDHRIWIIGDQPCDEHGKALPAASAQGRAITNDLAASFMISSKPLGGYPGQQPMRRPR